LISLLFGSGSILAAVAALVLYLGSGVTASWIEAGTPPPFGASLLIAAVGLAALVGIVSAIASAVGGFLMAVIHILCKRWLFAGISLLSAACSSALWFYFVSKPLH
jgi:hypothetical protein